MFLKLLAPCFVLGNQQLGTACMSKYHCNEQLLPLFLGHLIFYFPSICLQIFMISIFLTVVFYKKDKEARGMFGGAQNGEVEGGSSVDPC